ncbi:UTP--glucose-1-phosphate uridylyltransferase [Aliarcobacter butzleri]|uniref:hypothetical protein n=1 Tax=Aliarcobacter butzleri TaxID=28197 RepID=UPI00125F672F|nr:hypothetical protein [Aliarcobacter butzleri]MCT7604786.1 UTP--glucose-1-phosphate uridylyltransferase [Aliarcobacter butzleri]
MVVSSNNNYSSIEEQILIEFEHISDFVWKSHNLISQEKERENKIYNLYTSEGSNNLLEIANMRWEYESFKIDKVFPYIINTNNLFTIISILEHNLLKLAKIVEKLDNSIRLENINGSGINKLFKYFKQRNINLETIDKFTQIQASIKIRNCFFHASGILMWSKDNTELLNIVKNKTYYVKGFGDNFNNDDAKEYNIKIKESDFGEQLELTHYYTFILTGYVRDFLKELCHILGDKYEQS